MSDMANLGIPARPTLGVVATLLMVGTPTTGAATTTVQQNPSSSGTVRFDLRSNTTGWQQFIEWSALRGKVLGWQSLPQGWDGDEGLAPQAATVQAALNFMAIARGANLPLPQVYIAGDGEVGFRWARGDAFASIAFLDDGDMVGVVRAANGQRIEFEHAAANGCPREFMSVLSNLA